MADARTDGAHPQAATRGWRGAGDEQASPAAARPSEGTDPKKEEAWRGARSAGSVRAQVQKTYAQKTRKPSAGSAQAQRRAGSGAQKRNAKEEKKKRGGGGENKCAEM